jgi:hypothetical protein
MENSKKFLLLIFLSTSLINIRLTGMGSSNQPEIWENTTTSLTGQDIRLKKSVMIKGSCLIDGNGTNLFFSSDTSITVAENSTLCLKNITLCNLLDEKIKLTSNTSKILISGNVTWQLGDYFILNSGNFTQEEGSVFKIDSTNGTGNFFYKTPEKSILHPASVLIIQNIIFTYSPTNNQPNLLETEKNSAIKLINSTFSLKQNLQLLRCWFIVEGTLKLMAEKDCMLFLGDGKNKENNTLLDIAPIFSDFQTDSTDNLFSPSGLSSNWRIKDTDGKLYPLEDLYNNKMQELRINNVE